ncbi:hypothetical protein [Methylovulum psychrotolerans]|uniref:Uncharacterized protein n=1 Tax=Methylovulum psychrotolerans TaxID=1704499 RepID=A0A2S5CQE3_9GAMM|nr:hypothetical protein [Methylovulum psychrotolerans]POZ52977.1 hypothetical protein AADEFJLK_01593 [Methylovulum psychrotolerans]
MLKIELTDIEKAALLGNPTDEARAKAKKREAAETKQAALAQADLQQQQRQLEQQHEEMAKAESERVTQQIVAECQAMLSPLVGFSPNIDLQHSLNSYGLHLKHRSDTAAIQAERDGLQQEIAGIDGKIAGLEKDKAALMADRTKADDPNTVGKLGIIMMDLDVLAEVRRKYAAAINSLPSPQRDWGGEGWESATKAARMKALRETADVAERTLKAALVKLRESGAVSYNHSRTVWAN